MGRFSAAAQVAAFFLLIASPLARACEDCERLPQDPPPTGRVDVTAAVDAATSFVAKAIRNLYPSYDVKIVEGDAVDAVDTTPTVAEYAADYDARDGQSSVELPGFRHRSAWQLTYRDQEQERAALSQRAKGERIQGTDVTLDDSKVIGLRFEFDYGWKR